MATISLAFSPTLTWCERRPQSEPLDALMSQKDWLGTAEKIVFDAIRLCAPYGRPFSINNPGGWRYWLIHFANAYRARQVYNNILHDNASLQAHFGRSGLNMPHILAELSAKPPRLPS
jgi:hypothetical protein